MFGVSKEPSDRKCPIIRKKRGNSIYNQTLINKMAQDFGPPTHFRSKLDIIFFSPIKGKYQVFLGSNLPKLYRPTTSSKREAEEFWITLHLERSGKLKSFGHLTNSSKARGFRVLVDCLRDVQRVQNVKNVPSS